MREKLPFLLRLEDDIYIVNAPFLKRLCCFLTRFLTDRRRREGEHLHLKGLSRDNNNNNI